MIFETCSSCCSCETAVVTAPQRVCPITTIAGAFWTVTANSKEPITVASTIFPAFRTTKRSPIAQSKIASGESLESAQVSTAALGQVSSQEERTCCRRVSANALLPEANLSLPRISLRIVLSGDQQQVLGIELFVWLPRVDSNHEPPG